MVTRASRGRSSAAAATLPKFPPAPGEDELSSLELAYQRIRSAILSNELQPGSVISQVKLSRAVGVSRTPLREALRLLQNEGLVSGRHNHRLTVSELTDPDLEELYALRISNEAMAIRASVPHLTASDLAEIRALLDRMVQVEKEGDFATWEVVHHDFHRGLLQHAGPRMVSLTEELATHAERYRRAYVSSVPRAWAIGDVEHESLYQRCAAGDVDNAARELAMHLGRTALSLITAHRPDYDPAAIRAAIRLFAGQS